MHCLTCVRYLGILLDEQLNWKFQINALCNNLRKIVSAFKLIKEHFLSELSVHFVMGIAFPEHHMG